MERPTSGSWPTVPRGRVVVELTCAGSAAELVADRLFTLGASAVAEAPRSAGTPTDSPHDGVPPADRLTLVADVAAVALDELTRWCAAQFPPVVLTWARADPAWVDAWRPYAVAHHAGPLLVRQPWVDATPGPGEIDLVVDPGPTFGSGSHPSTRMCLAALGEVLHGGERVLDVGCGSGILAVGALLLGAGSATGVDIDPDAGRVSGAVAHANGVADRYRFVDGGLEGLVGTDRGGSEGNRAGGAGDEQYDVVVANLLVGTVEELGGRLVSRCAGGGTIVLGGLLVEHRDRALAALGARRVVAEHTEDDWLVLVTR